MGAGHRPEGGDSTPPSYPEEVTANVACNGKSKNTMYLIFYPCGVLTTRLRPRGVPGSEIKKLPRSQPVSDPRKEPTTDDV